MLNTFFYPDSLTYLFIKLMVLAIVLLLWFALTTAPVV